MRESMVMYKSYRDAAKTLTGQQRLAFYDALFDYAFDDLEPDKLKGISKAAFLMAKPQIDANAKRYEHGKMGGRPPKTAAKETGGFDNADEKETTGYNSDDKKETSGFENDNHRILKNKPNDNDNDNDNVNDNDNDNVNDNDDDNDNGDGLEKRVEVEVRETEDFVVTEYGRLCPQLQPVKTVTDKRREAIRLLRQTFNCGKITELFTKAGNTPFLCGKGDKGWVAYFDWLIIPENASKVLEGFYDSFRPPEPEQPPGGSFDTDEFVQAALARSAKIPV